MLSRCIAVGLAVIMTTCLAAVHLVECGNTASAATTSVKINATNFPDPIFRSVIASRDYDRDGNGVLNATEIGLTLNIYCEGMGIKSIKGVEFFTDLQGLWCKDNAIESMDIRKLKDLRGLWCSNNKLKKLDITQNERLVWVYCYDNMLTELDVSHNPKMAFIECNTNPITKLDVSHNPELEHLTCGSCELTTLDISHNPELAHLDAFSNHLKKLDVTKNPKMKRLDIWDNAGLGSIDISKNPGLQYYNCAYNGATKVDVSHNPELYRLICSYNELTKLDISNNPKLAGLNCEDNSLTSLDISHNPQLRYLQAAINPFTKLDIGNNPFLLKTYREGTFVKEWYGRSWTIDYGGDDSTGGDTMFYMWINEGITLSTKQTGSVTLPKEQYSPLDPGVSVDDLITREAVVSALYKLAGSPDVSGLTSRFTDVKKGEWYEKALLWGEKNSICVGYPYTTAETFGIGKYITRQDLMYMLMRYSEVKKLKRSIDFGRSDEYIDYYSVDYDHWEAVCWCATWIILEGKGEDESPKSEQLIDPYGRVSYAELVTAFSRLYEVNKMTVTSTVTKALEDAKNAPVNGKVKLIFKLNGGSIGAPATITKNVGETAIVPKCAPYRAGYWFAGWALSDKATTPAYKSNSAITLAGGSVTLYAVWQKASAMTYRVSYDRNGGTGAAPAPSVVLKGSTVTVPSSSVSRQGYYFLGWSTKRGGDAVYKAGSTIKVNESIVLYAVWKPRTNTVTFDANGGSGTLPAAIKVLTGKTGTVGSGSVSRSGYWFLGWSTSKTATTATYKSGSSVSVSADTVLYAVWEKIKEYRVSFDRNGGTGKAPAAMTVLCASTVTVPQCSVTRDGYYFLGWSTTRGGAVAYKSGSTFKVYADTVLYAVWKKK